MDTLAQTLNVKLARWQPDVGQPHTFLNKKKRYILTSTKVGGNNRRIEDI
jgi:hypothetical protein